MKLYILLGNKRSEFFQKYDKHDLMHHADDIVPLVKKLQDRWQTVVFVGKTDTIFDIAPIVGIGRGYGYDVIVADTSDVSFDDWPDVFPKILKLNISNYRR